MYRIPVMDHTLPSLSSLFHLVGSFLGRAGVRYSTYCTTVVLYSTGTCTYAVPLPVCTVLYCTYRYNVHVPVPVPLFATVPVLKISTVVFEYTSTVPVQLYFCCACTSIENQYCCVRMPYMYCTGTTILLYLNQAMRGAALQIGWWR